MRKAEGSNRGVTRRALLALPGTLNVERIVVRDLGPDIAAQIIRVFGEYRIQVASEVARGERAAVARHVQESHHLRCCAADCEDARRWLAKATPLTGVYAVQGA